jgi:hypothetical protein
MSSRTVAIEARVYAVVDAVGDLHTAVCEQECDEIYIEALCGDGLYATFQAEAYHLELWAQEKELEYMEGIIETDVLLEVPRE